VAVMRDGTGIAAVYGHPRAARVVARCLRALTHRGGGAAGLVVTRRDGHRARHGADLRLLDDEPALDLLVGHIALGQVHVGAGSSPSDDPWVSVADGVPLPVSGRLSIGPVAVSVAGEITNADAVRAQLLEAGAVLRGDGLAELILHLIARSGQRTAVNRLVDALWQVRGAFSVVMTTASSLIVVRDPHGIRPLVLGRLDGAVLAVSEEIALHEVGGHVLRHVPAGEMVVVDARGIVQVQPFLRRRPAPCVQEIVQLSRSGSSFEGWAVHQLRGALGEALAQERAPGDGQLVIAADEVSVPAALGYARGARLPYEQGLVGRRDGGVLVGVPEAVVGRRVVLVAAAMGAGRHLRKAIEALTRAGASAVHLRVASPRLTAGCPYGVDGPSAEELDEALPGPPGEVARVLGAVSVGWLSIERLRGVLGLGLAAERDVCAGCLGGPLPVAPEAREEQLGLFKGDEPGSP
jgi:amidophosphoribosyltransferase